MNHNKEKKLRCDPNISLLSNLYDIETDIFNYAITTEEVNNFNSYKECSYKLIELCLHHILSSYEYNSRQGYLSLLIIFYDYINKSNIGQHKGGKCLLYLQELYRKRIFFIPLYDNSRHKWSLIIIDSFSLLFKQKVVQDKNEEAKEEENKDDLPPRKFRIIVLSSFQINTENLLNTILAHLNQIFNTTSVLQKEMLAKEINKTSIIHIPCLISEFESALFLLKLIFGGIKSDNVYSYLETIIKTHYDSAYIRDLKNNIFFEIQTILQLKIINIQEVKQNKQTIQLEPLPKITGIKEIKIVFSNEEKKHNIFPIYTKPIASRNIPNTDRYNTPSNFLLTEQSEESKVTNTHRQLLSELNPNTKDFLGEDTYICQTEPSHAKKSSWPLTPKKKLKTIQIPLIKTNLNLAPKKIYKHKVLSRNNTHYLAILMRDASMHSQPDNCLSKRSNYLNLDLPDDKPKMIFPNSIEDNDLSFLPRGLQIPRKSVKKPLETKSTMSSQLFTVRDYSTRDFVNNEDKNKNETCDNLCNGCDWNKNCVII